MQRSYTTSSASESFFVRGKTSVITHSINWIDYSLNLLNLIVTESIEINCNTDLLVSFGGQIEYQQDRFNQLQCQSISE